MKKSAFARLQANDVPMEPVTEVNVIPIIDISLVLLVVLFVTAPLLSYPSLPIELPTAAAKESEERVINVTLTGDGRLAIASRDLDWAGLEEAVRGDLAKLPGAPVVLRVDQGVPYRSVEKLIAACKKAGAAQISLATQPRK